VPLAVTRKSVGVLALEFALALGSVACLALFGADPTAARGSLASAWDDAADAADPAAAP
jgi:hypothetical protein